MKIESGVNGYARSFPTEFVRANGEFLFDIKGRRYLDFFCGAGALNYGHNHPKIKREIIEFLELDYPIHCLDMDTVVKREFLQKFTETILSPKKLNYKIQFPGPTGTNAVEAAIKLARKYTGRKQVISFTNSFHGMTATSLALSSSQELKFKSLPSQDVIFFPFDGFLGENLDTVDLLKKMITSPGSGINKPAAIILETVQAEGGVNVARIDWLLHLREFTALNDIVLIVDDIQVGCGRAGSFFSFERAGIAPDIVLLSKSISGCGLPLSLILLKPNLDVWEPGEHNGTFRANNLALKGATSALDFWKKNEFEKEINSRELLIEKRLASLPQRHNQIIKEVRGIGLVWGIEFFHNEIARRCTKYLFEEGMLIERCGNLNQVIKLLPPLTITPGSLIEGLEKIIKVIQHASKEMSQLIDQTA